MASTIVQVVMQGYSGISRDRFVNTLYFQGDDWDGSQTDELWSHWTAYMGNLMGGYASGPHWIKCYHWPGPNPAGPYWEKSYTRAQSSNSAPSEVALCLSYASTDNPDQATKRRRGRIYLGPLSQSAAGGDRPSSTVIDWALDLGEAIATVGLAGNVTWALHSPTDGSLHKIESIWVDDAWDTQRRRGLRPTQKTARDVQ